MLIRLMFIRLIFCALLGSDGRAGFGFTTTIRHVIGTWLGRAGGARFGFTITIDTRYGRKIDYAAGMCRSRFTYFVFILFPIHFACKPVYLPAAVAAAVAASTVG